MLRWVLECVDALAEGAGDDSEGPPGEEAWEDVDEAGDLKGKSYAFMRWARRKFKSWNGNPVPKRGPAFRALLRRNGIAVPDLWPDEKVFT
jgi:flavodoxin